MDNIDNIYEELVRIKSGVKGSTPRPEGSKMLVRSDETILGSICLADCHGSDSTGIA